MNNQIYNFLALLGRAANTNSNNSLIEPIDWSAIFKIARAHNVFALIFDKASEVPEFTQLPEYISYMDKAMRMVADQMKRTQAFLKLYHAFAEEGLYPIVMKGIVCRKLYGKYCDHRPSGDEDILIRKEDYKLAEHILKSQGFVSQYEQVTLQQLEELQEVSFYNKTSKLHIELHTNPIGHENHLRYEMNELFKDVTENYREIEINGVMMHTMNHTDHFLFLILHSFKHLMTTGFGIRQVLDILLYYREFACEINWDIVESSLKKVGATDFVADIVYIGNKYLGFDLPVIGSPVCPEELLEDLIGSGIFGNRTQAQKTAFHMTNAAVNTSGKQSKAAVWLSTIFPGRAHLLNLHPELQEKPWLLPVRWVQRWVRFIKHNRRNKGNLAKESMEISQRRINLLKKYKIL